MPDDENDYELLREILYTLDKIKYMIAVILVIEFLRFILH